MPFSVGIQGQKKWRNPGHFLVVYSKPGVTRHASKDRQNHRGGEGGGGKRPFDFNRSINPISTGGADYAHHITLPPLILRPFYGPAVATVYRPLYVATDTVGQKGQKKGRYFFVFFNTAHSQI